MFSETLLGVFNDLVKIEVSQENIAFISQRSDIEENDSKILALRFQASLENTNENIGNSSMSSLSPSSEVLISIESSPKIREGDLQSSLANLNSILDNTLNSSEDLLRTPDANLLDIETLEAKDKIKESGGGENFGPTEKNAKEEEKEKEEIWSDEEEILEKIERKSEKKIGNDQKTLFFKEKAQDLAEGTIAKPPKSKKPTQNNIYSPCSYLQNTISCEKFLLKVTKIFNLLKNEMGQVFTKIVEEAKTRESRSPIRSPIRRSITSGLSTPAISQKSINTSIISNFRCDEENILDVFSTVDLSIEKVSIKNIDCLARCICGMLGKKLLTTGQNDEIKAVSQIVDDNNKSEGVFRSSIKATKHEFQKEVDNYELFIQKTKENNNNLQSLIDSTSKKIELLQHEKEKLSKKLQVVKEEREKIYKSTSQSSTWEEIRSFAEALTKLDAKRSELDEKIIMIVGEYKSYNEESEEILKKMVCEKEILNKEVMDIKIDIDKLENNSAKMIGEILGLSGVNYVNIEFEKMFEYFKNQYEDCCMNNEKMKKELIKLRMSKDESHTDTIFLLQKIEKDTNLTQKSQISNNKSSHIFTETLSDLQKQLKKLKSETSHIEEIYNRKLQVEKTIESLYAKYKTCESNKDILINEINYFSDFIFSFSQSNLHQKRISENLKFLINGKNMEIEALRDAVNELKEQNPIYTPVEGDYIDEALANYLNSRDSGLVVPFRRVAYGVYYFGNKKVMISYERNKLITKSGGGFISLENFIETFTAVEMEKIEKTQENLRNRGKGKDTKEYIVEKEIDEEILRGETPIIEEDI
ncbi:hypothetical protein SteCoe_21449 [Stentor coeruleus]|uniref:GAR domain-containing protein n=1 Tax=Stentor coeruleus TaxID=5963 RepID=A0A1R2BPM0_9CILI|nr:hypothetical protein SteCoe_21449 [Stentor coeruleus]